MERFDDREEAVFQAALKLPPKQRAIYLDEACGKDAKLRQQVVERLFKAGEKTAALPEQPLPGLPSATVVAPFKAEPGERPGDRIGHYKLIEMIGEGGMGSVWVAIQTEPFRREVALKIIKLGMDTKQVIARFEAERQVLALMDHPNIARVLDAGATETGRPYFVMERIKGIPITRYSDDKKLDIRQRLELFIQVCQAVQHAHQKGIIHRDIKPSNILVVAPEAQGDGKPIPKVIDFGIAKATSGQALTDKSIHTMLAEFIGTPAYMSPEQAEMNALDIDTRSDIYSLGVLLYELLTGQTPFDPKELFSRGMEAMRKTIQEKEPVPPSTKLHSLQGEELTTTAKRHGVDVPKLISLVRGDLDWIVMKCLEKDRTRRYETANGLAVDITRHLNDEPVTACPPSAAYRFHKAWKRNKFIYSASAAVALALVAGLALSLWQYVGKSRAEREQARLRQQAESKAKEAGEARTLAAQERDLANQRLYESLLREVRSIRKARQVGYRREMLDLLKQAASLDIQHKDMTLLRSEAAASFGDWVGLDPAAIHGVSHIWFGILSDDGTLAAIAHGDQLTISLYETQTGRELASLALGGSWVSYTFDQRGTALYFSIVDQPFVAGKRPNVFRNEKWSLREDGSWKKDWSRNETNGLFYALTKDGPVELKLLDNDAAFSMVAPDGGSELARIPVDAPLPSLPNPALSLDHTKFACFIRGTSNSFDEQVEFRDLTTGTVKIWSPHQGSGRALAFSDNGNSLVATFAAKVIVYDMAQLSPALTFQGTFEDTLGASPGGPSDLLALPALQEVGVRLIQMDSARQLAFLDSPLSPKYEAFNRDGSVLLVTYYNGARIFHLRAGPEMKLLEGHQGGVPAVEFLPDGRRLVSTGKDRTLRLWELDSGRSQILGQLPDAGQTLSVTPEGSLLACGYYDVSGISLWSLPLGKQLYQLKQTQTTSGTTWHCAFSPSGSELAAVGRLGLTVWDTRVATSRQHSTNAQIPLLLSAQNGLAGPSFNAAGTELAYAASPSGLQHSPDLLVRRLEPDAQPQLVASNIEINPIQSLCFLPRSGRLAYVTMDRELAILEPDTWRVLSKTPTLNPNQKSGWYVANLTVSPDESRFAIVTPSGLGVELRDTSTGALIYTLPEETGAVWWLAWSPDSRQLVVSRDNGEIAVWNLQEVESQLARLGLKP